MQVKNADDLSAAINSLERQQVLSKELIAENFGELKESIAPANLLKDSIQQVKNSPALSNKLINSGLGYGAGILARRLVVGNATGFVSNFLGTAVKLGMMGLVARNGPAIRRTGVRLLKAAFGSRRR